MSKFLVNGARFKGANQFVGNATRPGTRAHARAQLRLTMSSRSPEGVDWYRSTPNMQSASAQWSIAPQKLFASVDWRENSRRLPFVWQTPAEPPVIRAAGSEDGTSGSVPNTRSPSGPARKNVPTVSRADFTSRMASLDIGGVELAFERLERVSPGSGDLAALVARRADTPLQNTPVVLKPWICWIALYQVAARGVTDDWLTAWEGQVQVSAARYYKLFKKIPDVLQKDGPIFDKRREEIQNALFKHLIANPGELSAVTKTAVEVARQAGLPILSHYAGGERPQRGFSDKPLGTENAPIVQKTIADIQKDSSDASFSGEQIRSYLDTPVGDATLREACARFAPHMALSAPDLRSVEIGTVYGTPADLAALIHAPWPAELRAGLVAEKNRPLVSIIALIHIDPKTLSKIDPRKSVLERFNLNIQHVVARYRLIFRKLGQLLAGPYKLPDDRRAERDQHIINELAGAIGPDNLGVQSNVSAWNIGIVFFPKLADSPQRPKGAGSKRVPAFTPAQEDLSRMAFAREYDGRLKGNIFPSIEKNLQRVGSDPRTLYLTLQESIQFIEGQERDAEPLKQVVRGLYEEQKPLERSGIMELDRQFLKGFGDRPPKRLEEIVSALELVGIVSQADPAPPPMIASSPVARIANVPDVNSVIQTPTPAVPETRQWPQAIAALNALWSEASLIPFTKVVEPDREVLLAGLEEQIPAFRDKLSESGAIPALFLKQVSQLLQDGLKAETIAQYDLEALQRLKEHLDLLQEIFALYLRIKELSFEKYMTIAPREVFLASDFAVMREKLAGYEKTWSKSASHNHENRMRIKCVNDISYVLREQGGMTGCRDFPVRTPLDERTRLALHHFYAETLETMRTMEEDVRLPKALREAMTRVRGEFSGFSVTPYSEWTEKFQKEFFDLYFKYRFIMWRIEHERRDMRIAGERLI